MSKWTAGKLKHLGPTNKFEQVLSNILTGLDKYETDQERQVRVAQNLKTETRLGQGKPEWD